MLKDSYPNVEYLRASFVKDTMNIQFAFDQVI
jgi:hypothetical protein